MKYLKKPIVIEAEQFLPGDGVKEGDVFEAHGALWKIRFNLVGPCIVINTSEGDTTAGYGDWIIKGVKGELYPCKADIFEATYEQVD